MPAPERQDLHPVIREDCRLGNEDGLRVGNLFEHPYLQVYGRTKDGRDYALSFRWCVYRICEALVFKSTGLRHGAYRNRLDELMLECSARHTLDSLGLRDVKYFHRFDPLLLARIREMPGWQDYSPVIHHINAPKNYESLVRRRDVLCRSRS